MKKTLTLFSIAGLLVASISLQTAVAQSWNITGNNGTDSSKLGTTNSISLKIFTKNLERMRIDSNGRVGIGMSPVNIFTLKSSGGTPAASWLDGISSPVFMSYAENFSGELVSAVASNIITRRPVFHGRRSRGTLAAPAAVIKNDYLSSVRASGYDGATYQSSATIDFFVDSTPSPGNVATRISFATGSNADSRLERLKVGSDGNFNFNNNQLFLRHFDGNIGIGTTSPNASSLLEIKSTTKGFLTSRMTKTQRDSVASPATGLLIYQTNNIPGFYYYNGSVWAAISSNNSSGWALSGNLGTIASTNFIGTTDSQALVFKVNNIRSGYIDNNSSTRNTSLGYQGLINNDNGFANTALGYNSLYLNTDGYSNTAIGNNSLSFNTGGWHNTAIGVNSLYRNTYGFGNTAIGYYALVSNTIGEKNTATGKGALGFNTTGSNNTANGENALTNNITGSDNTAIGFWSLFSSKAGSGNTASGNLSLFANETGSYNTASGDRSLFKNNTGSKNTAFGADALSSNKVSFNSAVGYRTLFYNTSGHYNTANGSESLFYNAIGSYNTAVGHQALLFNTDDGNTAVGYEALSTNKSGFYNTSVGIYADVSTANLENATAIGAHATVNASNKIRLGNASISVVESNAGSWTVSDGRFKSNIAENVKGLEFIKLLKPVTYNFETKKFQEFLLHHYPDSVKSKKMASMNKGEMAKTSSVLQSGFIAQDVAEAAKKSGYNFNGVHAPENATDNWSLSYEKLVVPLVKAIQELSKKNDDKDAKIDSQDKKIDLLQKQLDELKAILLSGNQNNSPQALSNASLAQNVPNPFKQGTSIAYNLPQKFTTAQITITDISGKTVKTIKVSGQGYGKINVEAALLAAGAYNYSLIVDGKLAAVKQMVLAK